MQIAEVMATGKSAAYIFGCSRQPLCAGGRLIATACADAKLRLWALGPDGLLSFLHEVELSTGTAGSRMILTSCAFDPLGLELACTARDGTIFILVSRSYPLFLSIWTHQCLQELFIRPVQLPSISPQTDRKI